VDDAELRARIDKELGYSTHVHRASLLRIVSERLGRGQR
jgi:hypothetical protein